MLALTAGVCAGQVPPSHYIEISLPPGVASEGVFIRYVLAGEKFGGWTQPRSGLSSYIIGTVVGVLPATGIKAIVYAPGCTIQTLDVRLSVSRNEQYPYLCKPLGSVSIAGRLTQPDSLTKHDARLQARYIAQWAHSFLGLADDSVLVIPIGDSTAGAFRRTAAFACRSRIFRGIRWPARPALPEKSRFGRKIKPPTTSSPN